MHSTQHRKSHGHVQPAARASFSLSMTLQEHRACVRLQNLSAKQWPEQRSSPPTSAIASSEQQPEQCSAHSAKQPFFHPLSERNHFLQPHVAESTTIPSQFRTFPCIVPPSQKTAARAALSAHCKAVAKAALNAPTAAIAPPEQRPEQRSAHSAKQWPEQRSSPHSVNHPLTETLSVAVRKKALMQCVVSQPCRTQRK